MFRDDWNHVLVGGLSAALATIVCNPLDVIKTRMQLQEELSKRKAKYQKTYRNSFHAARVIFKYEGFLGFGLGTVPGVLFQFIFNAIRLGAYDKLSSIFIDEENDGEFDLMTRILVAGAPASVGMVLANPFYVVKIRLQARAHPDIAHGHQHNNQGRMSVEFSKILKYQGFRYLYAGSFVTIPLAFLLSSCQLVTYDYFKFFISHYTSHEKLDNVTVAAAGIGSGLLVAIFMAPVDVIFTRLYNQGYDRLGRGALYAGLKDGVQKIYSTEGIYGLYKGLGATYIKIGPHNLLTLFFWDTIKDLIESDD